MFDYLDIDSDFWANPTNKLIFKKEYEDKIPSEHMWALLQLVHPKSKFSDLDSENAKAILHKDYLKSDKEFSWVKYNATIPRIIEALPSAPERFLATWRRKLSEIQSFINSKPYNEDSYEMLTKIMKDFHPMMKQYKEIEKDYTKEVEANTRGAIEESLTEKGII